MGRFRNITGTIFRGLWRTGAWVWWAFSLVIALAVVILWAWNWWLPSYLGQQVLPSVADRFGVSNLHCDVRRVGVTGMDLANVSITDRNGRALGINSVRMDYSLHWPGRDKRSFLVIDQVAVSGLQVGVRIDESGAVAIDGLDWAEILRRLSSTTAQTKTASGQVATASGVQIRTVLFENIRLYLAWKDELLVVPSEVRIDLENGQIQITGSLDLRSGTLDFVAAIDPTAKTAAVKVVGTCPLEHFSGLLPFDYRGDVTYSAVVRLPLGCRWPSSAELEVKLTDGPEYLRNLNCRIAFSAHPDGSPGGTVTADLDGDDVWTKGEFHLAGGEIVPQPDGRIRFSGAPEFELTPEAALPVRFAAPVKGNFSCTAEFAPDGFEWNIAAGRLQIPELGFGPDGVVAIPAPIGFEARFNRPAGAKPTWHYRVTGPALTARAAGVEAAAPGWRGEGSETGSELALDAATVNHPKSGVRAEGIRLRARYPEAAAELNVDRILWRDNTPAAGAEANFKLGESRRQIDFQARLKSFVPLTESMTLKLSGNWQFNGNYELDAKLPTFKLPEGTDLGQFTGGQKLLVSGNISAQAGLRSKDDVITSDGRLSLTRLSAELPESGFAVKNMNLVMKFTDLFTLRTPTGQRLTVEELRAGVLNMKHGEISFKIDSPQQINLEDSSIEWCGGTLSTRYLRIVPGRNFYQTTVQCENLNLAQVLTELGLVRAEGDGRVWGKMPIRFSSRGMFFNTSYLYSIPGESSSIRISNADALLNNMSPELARSIQGELTVAALQDFQYNWARMNFFTEDEDLVINLKFNGKPNKVLPFRYDTETGSLVQVSAEAGAIFQGIDLDFTARFPLNRMMKLSQRLNKIWGKP